MRLALRGAHAGAWEIDLNRNTVFWGDELNELYGFDGSRAPSFERWTQSIHEDDRERVVAELESRLRSAATEFEREFRVSHPQRGTLWILDKGRIERDASGQPLRVHGIDIDVTERKLAEQALRDADRRKGVFLATLAHELRNPLAPLRNGLEIMHMASDDPARVEAARRMMDRQLTHLIRLIDDLLDVSRVSQGKIMLRKSRVQLADTLEQAVEACRPIVDEYEHDLIVDLGDAPIYVDADVTRLVQIISNLLSNAAKFTPHRGRIWLSTYREDRQAVIDVRDNGIGISADMFDSIFEMFAQASPAMERKIGGLGVGLALVKGLVELHGGSVQVRSAGTDQGSQFIVRLPLASSVRAEEHRKPQNQDECERSHRKILVVDDNCDSAKSLVMMFELWGHETRVAYSGPEGLAIAENFHPELIFLDIGMPSLDGYEVARRIRQQAWGREIKLIAITGWGQEEDRRRSEAAGFDLHLVKPVELSAVKKLLD